MTLEEKIKHHSGLTIGRHVVDFTHKGAMRRGVVEISPRGVVRAIAKPKDSDMYTSWFRVKGDTTNTRDGAVIVWAARDPSLMGMFEGPAAAVIDIAP